LPNKNSGFVQPEFFDYWERIKLLRLLKYRPRHPVKGHWANILAGEVIIHNNLDISY